MFNASYARLQESHVYKRDALFFDYIGPFQASVQQTVRALSQAPPFRLPGPFWLVEASALNLGENFDFQTKPLLYRLLFEAACWIVAFPCKKQHPKFLNLIYRQILQYVWNPLHNDHQMYLRRHERTMSVEMARTIVQTRKTTTGTSQASLRSEVCQVQHGGFWGLW